MAKPAVRPSPRQRAWEFIIIGGFGAAVSACLAPGGDDPTLWVTSAAIVGVAAAGFLTPRPTVVGPIDEEQQRQLGAAAAVSIAAGPATPHP